MTGLNHLSRNNTHISRDRLAEGGLMTKAPGPHAARNQSYEAEV